MVFRIMIFSLLLVSCSLGTKEKEKNELDLLIERYSSTTSKIDTLDSYGTTVIVIKDSKTEFDSSFNAPNFYRSIISIETDSTFEPLSIKFSSQDTIYNPFNNSYGITGIVDSTIVIQSTK